MSVAPHTLPETLRDPRPAPRQSALRVRAFARECGWLLLTALAAAAALALFVRVTGSHTGEPLADLMLRPINVLRLTVLTACLGLWNYILRSARGGAAGREASAPAQAGRARAAEMAGRG